MFQYLVRRLLIALPVLLGITLINFYIVNLAPGDAVDLMVNPGLTKADLVLQREKLGLNEPLHVRYVHWLGNLVKGDLGSSFTDQRSVNQRIGERIGPTLALMFTDVLDPDVSSQVRTDAVYNTGKYANPKADALLDKGVLTAEFNARKQIYDEFQKLVYDDPNFVYLYSPNTLSAVSKRMVNVKQSALGATWNIHEWDVK